MKLHLPKMLLTAVLAAVTLAPAAWGETVTVTTETSVGSLEAGYTGIIINNGGILDFGSASGSTLADGITINDGGIAKYSGTNGNCFAPGTKITINGNGELQLLSTNDGLGYNGGDPSEIVLKGTSDAATAEMNIKGRVTFGTTISMEGYASIGQTSDAVTSGGNRACLDTWGEDASGYNKFVIKNAGNVINTEILLRKDLTIETTAGGSLVVNGAVTRHASEQTGAQSVNISGNGGVTFEGAYASRELNVGGETEGVAHTTAVVLSGTSASIAAVNVKAGASLTLDEGSQLTVNNGKGAISNSGTLNLNGVLGVSRTLDNLSSYTLTDETGSSTSGNGWITGVTLSGIVSGSGTVSYGANFGLAFSLDSSSSSRTSTSATVQDGSVTATFATAGDYVVGAGKTVALTNDIASKSTTFTVLDGGTLDISGQKDDNLKNKDLTLYAGSSLINTGASHSNGNASFDVINLKGNASIGRESGTSNNIALLAGEYKSTQINLNGHTLTKKGNGVFHLVNSTISAGTLDIQGGQVDVRRNIALKEGAVINIAKNGTLAFANDGNTSTQFGDIISHATGSGNIKVERAANIAGGTSTQFSGKLTVNSGADLRIGVNGDADGTHATQNVDLSKLSGIVLNGGTLSTRCFSGNLGDITVNRESTLNIFDINDFDSSTSAVKVGVLSISDIANQARDLTVTNKWKSKLEVTQIKGAGTLWFTATRENSEGRVLTINSVKDFTGKIHVENHSGNKAFVNVGIKTGESLNASQIVASNNSEVHLTGAGDYNLGTGKLFIAESGSDEKGSLDASWTGKVKMDSATLSSANLSKYGNANSTISLNKIKGSLAAQTVAADIIMEGVATSGDAALRLDAGDGAAVSFSGNVSGNGNLVVTAGTNNLSFTGDVKEWGGRLIADVATTNVVYSGKATEVKNDILTGGDGAGRTINVTFKNNTGVTVSGDINEEKWSKGIVNINVANETAEASGKVTFTGTLSANANSGATNVNIGDGAAAEFTNNTVKVSNVNVGNAAELTFSGANGVSMAELLVQADGVLTVGTYTGEELTENTLTVTSSASFAAGAKVNANLVLSNGVELTLNGALTMGSTLKLGEEITLSGSLVAGLNDLEEGQSIALFSGVDSLTLGTDPATTGVITLDDGIKANGYFTGLADDLMLTYTGGENASLSITKMVSPVTPNVPEPTTATLSLLALAGLAARRRRK